MEIQPNANIAFLVNAIQPNSNNNTPSRGPTIKIRATQTVTPNTTNISPSPVSTKVTSKYITNDRTLQNTNYKPLPRNLNTITVQGIKPVFCLQNINVKQLAQKYLLNDFSNCIINPHSIDLVNNIIDIAQISDSFTDPIHKLNIAGGDSRIIATSNVNILEFSYKGSKYDLFECMFCRRTFKNLDLKLPTGIPIEMRRVANRKIYTMIECYCGFRCAYTNLLRKLGHSYTRMAPGYYNAEILMFNLFAEIYPGEELLPVPDSELLTLNQGSLTESMFYDTNKTNINIGFNTYPMVPNENINLKFIKNDYLVVNNN